MDKLDNFLNKIGFSKPAPEKSTVAPVNFKKPETPHHKNFEHKTTVRSFQTHRRPQPQTAGHQFQTKHGLLRVYPLGGFEEVGKNMTVFETDKDLIIIDMGLQFPEEDMYGVDYVIPDVSCLESKKSKIRGIIITHGHLDHIGAIPHLLPKLNFPPLYATPLTIGLITKRLEEFKLTAHAKLKTIVPSDNINFNSIKAEFFRVNHSIPDGVGIVLDTPAGRIVYTGDFKFDFTPADDKPSEFGRIAEVGAKGVLALFSDSTNASEPGYTISERVIGQELDRIIEKAKGRIIIATFSSLISRIDQIIASCNRHDRKVFLSGRSMEDNIDIAAKLNYVKLPAGGVRKLEQLRSLPDRKVTIITTGSQGEEMSALTRISLGTHQKIQIKPGDTVVLSSSPIMGNEKAIVTVVNNLLRLGANVVTNRHLDVHTSGHGKQEDLKLMISLVKPKFLIPIHGDLHMRVAHKDLAMQLGYPENHISLLDNGDILEFNDSKMRKSKSKITVNDITIDGRGIGNTESFVQRERELMSSSGIVVILFRILETGKLLADPQIISRGFLYQTEEKKITEDLIQAVKKAYNTEIDQHKKFDDNVRKIIRDSVTRAAQKVIRKSLDREPLILPLVVKS